RTISRCKAAGPHAPSAAGRPPWAGLQGVALSVVAALILLARLAGMAAAVGWRWWRVRAS
ncbi:hypothetical protein, partial [Nonomuraea wenchangensis]|uniref:hypothetical protein n=1 Tax=Nonomuraea wenchangensis TaxID=568860 RepID=UPI003330A478